MARCDRGQTKLAPPPSSTSSRYSVMPMNQRQRTPPLLGGLNPCQQRYHPGILRVPHPCSDVVAAYLLVWGTDEGSVGLAVALVGWRRPVEGQHVQLHPRPRLVRGGCDVRTLRGGGKGASREGTHRSRRPSSRRRAAGRAPPERSARRPRRGARGTGRSARRSGRGWRGAIFLLPWRTPGRWRSWRRRRGPRRRRAGRASGRGSAPRASRPGPRPSAPRPARATPAAPESWGRPRAVRGGGAGVK